MEQDRDEREAQIVRWMEQYERDVLKVALLYLGDTQLAQDAVQETFFKAYKGLKAFRGESHEKTWLMRIAVNTCRDFKRSAWARHVDRRVTLDGLPEPTQPCAEDDVLLTLEIMRLPRKEMEAVVLYYNQGMDLTQTAKALGVGESTISKRLTRAREKLRHALEGSDEHE